MAPTADTETPEDISVPDDAGVHADDLRLVIQRIPREWGRWFSCDKGWYPLIIKLDRELAEIAPDYELHQVKEKYGTLRYYTTLPQIVPDCCRQLERNDPRPHRDDMLAYTSPEYRTEAQQHDFDAWQERHDEHVNSPDCRAAWDALEEPIQRRLYTLRAMNIVIQRYEALSSSTCELCGTTIGVRLREKSHWYKTVCEPCGQPLGYHNVA